MNNELEARIENKFYQSLSEAVNFSFSFGQTEDRGIIESFIKAEDLAGTTEGDDDNLQIICDKFDELSVYGQIYISEQLYLI